MFKNLKVSVWMTSYPSCRDCNHASNSIVYRLLGIIYLVISSIMRYNCNDFLRHYQEKISLWSTISFLSSMWFLFRLFVAFIWFSFVLLVSYSFPRDIWLNDYIEYYLSPLSDGKMFQNIFLMITQIFRIFAVSIIL